MQDLLILGLGPHAAEMAEMTERLNRIEKRWKLLGYIAPDDRLNAIGHDFAGKKL